MKKVKYSDNAIWSARLFQLELDRCDGCGNSLGHILINPLPFQFCKSCKKIEDRNIKIKDILENEK